MPPLRRTDRSTSATTSMLRFPPSGRTARSSGGTIIPTGVAPSYQGATGTRQGHSHRNVPNMSKMSPLLSQYGDHLFLTDGGIETTLIFHEGVDLPYFAAFHLLRQLAGREMLLRYYERYIAIAKADGLGFIL